jgi:hypothetical protein
LDHRAKKQFQENQKTVGDKTAYAGSEEKEERQEADIALSRQDIFRKKIESGFSGIML